LLDAIVPDRPVYLYCQTGHEAWVNSKTLELIGLTADSKQDNKYIWDVDPKTGEPTGTIKEYAMSLVEQALEPTEASRIAPKIQETMETFSEHGFTSLKLAEGEETWVQAANQLDRQGKLDVRLFPSWFHRAHMGVMIPEESYAIAARWEEFKTEMVYP
jgi:predicted amidohydrolase YtcJ